MGRHSVPLPRELSSAPFRVVDAARSGVGAGRLRGPDLARPVRGVRMPANGDLTTRCRALLLHRRTDMWFSHLTAARLWGIPLPRHLEGEERIHVTVPSTARAPQIAGVVGHVATTPERTIHRALPLSTPAQTWLELAPALPRDRLIAAADYLLGASLTTTEKLQAAVDSAHGRRGIAAARLALPLIRQGAESPAESALRVLLHDAGIAPPELNYRIHARDGGFVARVDLAYPDQRLVLEYEGDHHRVDADQWHKDIRRQGRLEDLGWRVIRVTAADLASPGPLIARVMHALATTRD
ncbi:endonuclease domain-containing protein [Leifsonia sp. 22587]|uniref:endonuclease domain-containing protein n=1 Tax=Leifsonia sp. 22587 TaxID=3453946 RepID=UPI003F86BE62